MEARSGDLGMDRSIDGSMEWRVKSEEGIKYLVGGMYKAHAEFVCVGPRAGVTRDDGGSVGARVSSQNYR